eukprot:TRINITY_DN6888_c0_g1_i2.p1 TRINITY_DN6888_c0_g1~~TRINITY_DN6888_c0_g1_i2.p1  ORF type:complete len:1170 (-),score=155.10 TRINITY_DN6888_c0_g1_i2:604-4113(-)
MADTRSVSHWPASFHGLRSDISSKLPIQESPQQLIPPNQDAPDSQAYDYFQLLNKRNHRLVAVCPKVSQSSGILNLKSTMGSHTMMRFLQNESAQERYKFNYPDSLEEFQQRFDIVTRNMLGAPDSVFNSPQGEYIYVSGGSIVECMICTKLDIENDMNKLELFPNSDIDVFVVGNMSLDDRMGLVRKIFKDIEVARKKDGADCLLAETPNSYTSYSTFPYRPVQVIQLEARSIEDVLSHFDVDCGAFAFRGGTQKKLVCLRRAWDAIVNKANTVNLSLRTNTYENRLIRYSQRGFAVDIPKELVPEEVDLDKFGEMPGAHTHGFLRLLKHQMDIENQPQFAATETRQRYVPFVGFTLGALKSWLTDEGRKKHKYQMDYFGNSTTPTSSNDVVPLASFYIVRSSPQQLQATRWRKAAVMLQQPQYHRWAPVYTKPSLKKLINQKIVSRKEAQQYMAIAYSLNGNVPELALPFSRDAHKPTTHPLLPAEKVESLTKTTAELMHEFYRWPTAELHTHLSGMGSAKFWKDMLAETNKLRASRTIYDVEWYGPNLGTAPSKQASVFWRGMHLSTAQIEGPTVKCFDSPILLFPSHFNVSPTSSTYSPSLDPQKSDRVPHLHLSLKPFRVAINESMLARWLELSEDQLVRFKVPFSESLRRWVRASETNRPVRAFSKHFRSDIVLPLEKLLAFSDPTADPRPQLLRNLSVDPAHIHPMIFFNFVDQVFDYTAEGIALSDIPSKSARLFSYTDWNGIPLEDAALSSHVKDQFTPEFYPKKYIVRKLVLEQDATCITELLKHTLLEYLQSNVHYVEYSIGYADLLKPWVWPYFLHPNCLDTGVQFRFLAGFNRSEVEVNLGPGKKPAPIRKLQATREGKKRLRKFLEEISDLPGDEISPRIGFETFYKALDSFDAVMETRFLSDFVVGLDLFGDELYCPFIPFAEDKFVNYAKLRNQQRRFGFRIHCGEVTVAQSDSQYKKIYDFHVKTAVEALSTLVDAGIPLRVGHGLALTHAIKNEGDARFAKIKDLYWKIPIEICYTSNFQLVANPGSVNPHPTSKDHSFMVLKDKFPIIICTDNEGIFCPSSCRLINGPILTSLAYEMLQICKTGALRIQDMKDLADTARKASFVEIVDPSDATPSPPSSNDEDQVQTEDNSNNSSNNGSSNEHGSNNSHH